MKNIFPLLALLMIAYSSYKLADQKPRQDKVTPTVDSLLKEYNAQARTDIEQDPYDSLRTAKVDTSTPEGWRAHLITQFLLEASASGSAYDTAIDINYDGYKDYLIGFYYGSGTGLKNGVKVYTYMPKQKRYEEDTMLSMLPNATFYLAKHKITYFYLPFGVGHGGKFTFTGGR